MRVLPYCNILYQNKWILINKVFLYSWLIDPGKFGEFTNGYELVTGLFIVFFDAV